MRALLTYVLASLGLFAVLAAGSAQATDFALSGWAVEPVQDPVEEVIPIDIQGTIRQVPHFVLPWQKVWQITVNGHNYVLQTGEATTWKVLLNGREVLKDGMTVRVTGRLLHEIHTALMHTMEYPPRPQPPIHLWVVAANFVDTFPGKNSQNFARITVRGTFNLNAKFGYPQQRLKVVAAAGQSFVLDFGTMTGVGMLKLQELDGKTVKMEGEITGFRVRDWDELPVVRVAKLTLAEARIDNPGVRELPVKSLKATFRFQNYFGAIKITSAKELDSLFPGTAISKQVDFANEQCLLFAWKGSGQDRLTFVKVLQGKDGPEVVFCYEQGRTEDLREHVHLYVIPRNATWRFDGTVRRA